jgi:hypothetical protein
VATLRRFARQGDPFARREYDRYKRQYNGGIVDTVTFLEPDLDGMDVDLADFVKELPLEQYLDVRQKIGKVWGCSAVDIWNQVARCCVPAEHGHACSLAQLRRLNWTLSQLPCSGTIAWACFPGLLVS